MPEALIVPTIDAVPAAEWDALIWPGIERHAYLRAVEQAALAGFAWRYLVVRDGTQLIAAAPAFVTDYALDTTLGADRARLAATISRFLPRLMTQRMAALGSPCTETATIGFAPGLSADARRAAAAALLGALDRVAQAEGASLVVAKDLGPAENVTFGSLLAARGHSRVPSLPVASLPIDFDTVDEYLRRLSPGTRRDMRRKLRVRDHVRVERVRDIAPVLDRVMALYEQTRARADMKFELLTPAYFEGVLRAHPAHAFMALYWHGDALVAANLLLEEDGLLLDKFFCMDEAAGRPLNLYYLSWFENLAYCLDRHLVRYQAGQAAYANKLRLGSRLEPTTIWCRHRNALLNRLLGIVAPHLAPFRAEEAAA